MTQLRLVYASSNSDWPSTRRRPVKCTRLPTVSSTSLLILRKIARLQAENPAAVAIIERLVDRALSDLREHVG